MLVPVVLLAGALSGWGEEPAEMVARAGNRYESAWCGPATGST